MVHFESEFSGNKDSGELKIGFMAMGKRKRNRQRDLWISFGEMAKAPGHPFYERVNKVLEKAGFDDFVEQRCAQFYAAGMGRPSLAPGIYFRLLVVGYFEGLDSERGNGLAGR